MTGRFTDALRLEWVRITTVRSTYVLAAVAILVGAGAAALISGLGRGSGPDPTLSAMVLTSGADVVPLPFTATFMGVLGVLSVGHDCRHGLSRALLIAQPSRCALVAARLVVLAAASAGVAVSGLVLDGGLGAVLGGGTFVLDPDVGGACLGFVLLAVLWSWLGAAGTWLLRATVPVLVVLLVLPLVVEPLLRTLSLAQDLAWLRPVVRWLPFAAGRAMAAAVGGGSGEELGRAQGGVVFGGLVLAVLVPAWLLLQRRDA
jgi:ABC-2 type transport system permease protein